MIWWYNGMENSPHHWPFARGIPEHKGPVMREINDFFVVSQDDILNDAVELTHRRSCDAAIIMHCSTKPQQNELSLHTSSNVQYGILFEWNKNIQCLCVYMEFEWDHPTGTPYSLRSTSGYFQTYIRLFSGRTHCSDMVGLCPLYEWSFWSCMPA